MKLTELYTYTQLKRCLVFLFLVIVPFNSFAVDACVPNDSQVILLDPESTGYHYENGASWHTSNGYRGISACISYYSWNPKYRDVLTDNGVVINGGEALGDKCWCKVIYPVVTKWWPDGWDGYGSASGCQSQCASHCSWSFGDSGYKKLRTDLFNQIQN